MTATTHTPDSFTSERTRNRGCLYYVKRGLLALFIFVIALLTLGFSYEAIMAPGDAQRYPPIGQMVDVGGYKLHLHCVGEGSPTVLLMYGSGDHSLSWSLVQEPISRQGNVRVCAYDRAGIGWSEPYPQPGARTPAEIADELHLLLTNAEITSPYILVGHSVGGMYTRMYAIQHPDEVAGMVLVDARHESLDANSTPKTEEALNQPQPMNPMYEWLVRLGVVRLLGPSLISSLSPAAENLPPETLATYAALSGRLTTIQALANEEAGQTQDHAVLRANDSLGSLPLVVLASDSSIEGIAGWMQAQETMADLSSNSRFEIVPDGDHQLQWDHPESVISSVVDVIEAARAGEPLS
jgi:pimeloyl-ACP methyl ester carboxylesterase